MPANHLCWRRYARPRSADAGPGLEGAIRRAYANWADEPIPALNNKTPRQAMLTPAGLERVKGLLRSYEAGEAAQASQQGRPQVSYNFLWATIGVTR